MKHTHYIGLKMTDEQVRRLDGLATMMNCTRSRIIQTLVMTAQVREVETVERKPVGVVSAPSNEAVPA